MRAGTAFLRYGVVVAALLPAAVIVVGMLMEDRPAADLARAPESSPVARAAPVAAPAPARRDSPAVGGRRPGPATPRPALAGATDPGRPAPSASPAAPADEGTYITGSVTDGEGRPIPGARIRLMHRVRVPEPLAEALSRLNPDETQVQFRGRATRIRRGRRISVHALDSRLFRPYDRDRERALVRFASRGVLRSDPFNDPGAEVLDGYANTSGAFRLGPIDEVVPDPDGGEDGKGSLLVAASARGFVTRQMRFREAPLRFVLEASGSIRGQVTTSAARALWGYPVTLEGEDDEADVPIPIGGRAFHFSGPSRSTRTDASGHYRFDGLRPGRYRIALSDGLSKSAIVRGGGETTCNLILPAPPGTVHVAGQVVDAVDNRPLEGALVTGYLERKRVARKTGPDGRFDLGPVQRASGFRVTATDYAEAVVRFDGPGDGSPWLFKRIFLKRRPSVRGTVVDPIGRPVAGARVYGCSIATTDRLGRFHLTDLPPVKSTRLIAEAPGLARGISDRIELIPGKVIDNVVIRLGRGAWVGGRVVDPRGKPRDGLAVALEPVTAPPLGVRTANTDRRGWFELRVPAGRYRLTVKGRRGDVLESETLELSDGKRHFLKNLVAVSR